MHWTDDARKEMEKVPGFIRKMAIKAVEHHVASEGRQEIQVEDVHTARNKYINFAEKTPADQEVKRIAIVRCETVSEVCPGLACFKAFNKRRVHFQEYKDKKVEIIGYFTCGGCPGRRVSRLVDTLKKYDLDVVHLSSCMVMDGDYPKCPHYKEIRECIESKGIKVVEGTHH